MKPLHLAAAKSVPTGRTGRDRPGSECEISARTAQRCMNVANEFGDKYAAAAHLGVMALDMLAFADHLADEFQIRTERFI
jgi:hypothetical protein